ncbi:MAG: signal recognition particle-docking protein FtsY [Ignavibacteriaceae bacterium]|nr:signal recognition particle-docking protein FtsY [Ignavibacteriaceae bacterium]
MGMFDNFNFSKLKEGLSKTRNKIINTISETISGKAVIDDKTLDEIEEILITADIGFDTAVRIIENTRINLKSEKDRSELNILDTVKKELVSVFDFQSFAGDEINLNKFRPYVILIVGINGVGKTTTIGKLAYNFRRAGLKVIVGAADTFRAAAVEQLEIWAKRANVDIVQNKKGTDPSSVAFETVQRAIKENYDIVLIDTAGRLHNKSHLMDELGKIKRSIKKMLPYAPNDTYLVLDGNTGQNAIIQSEEFSKVTDITGLIVTKLDGTAKGGVIFQISSKQKIPVKYIGIGEGIDDLQTFIPEQFVNAIFDL